MAHISEQQKHAQYEEFFMRPSGKKHLIGGYSSMDNIILGRDIDNSGDDPHLTAMSRFTDHAGMKTGEKQERPFRRYVHAMSSTMDTLILGRDLDNSGEDPHEKFVGTYKGYAGIKGGRDCSGHDPNNFRPFRKGNYSMKCSLDQVLYGKDIDYSGIDPHNTWEATYSGSAGRRTDTDSKVYRPFRKPNCSPQAHVDTVAFHRDVDGTGDPTPTPQRSWMLQYPDYAGVKYDELVTTRPYRKHGLHQKAMVDDLIHHRDMDQSGPAPHASTFVENYSGYAGTLSGSRRAIKRYDTRGPVRSASVRSARGCSPPPSAPGDRGSQTARVPTKSTFMAFPARDSSRDPPLTGRSRPEDMRPAGLSTSRSCPTLARPELKRQDTFEDRCSSTAAPESPYDAGKRRPSVSEQSSCSEKRSSSKAPSVASKADSKSASKAEAPAPVIIDDRRTGAPNTSRSSSRAGSRSGSRSSSKVESRRSGSVAGSSQAPQKYAPPAESARSSTAGSKRLSVVSGSETMPSGRRLSVSSSAQEDARWR